MPMSKGSGSPAKKAFRKRKLEVGPQTGGENEETKSSDQKGSSHEKTTDCARRNAAHYGGIAGQLGLAI